MRNKKTVSKEQLPLWEEERQPNWHQHIEVHYEGGIHEIVCTELPYRVIRPEWEIYAGYVGPMIPPEMCNICNLLQEQKES